MIQKKKLLYIRLFLGLHWSYQQEKLYIYIYDKYILYIYLEHGRAVFVLMAIYALLQRCFVVKNHQTALQNYSPK